MNLDQPKLDYAIFMGRMHPVTEAHKNNIEYGLTIANKVIILIGSDNRPRSIKNPFTSAERIEMVERIYKNTPIWNRLIIDTLSDHLDDNDFVVHAQNKVNELIANDGCFHFNASVAITGYVKDSSSFYLNIFPWEFIPAPYTEPIGDFVLDATNVRNVLFDDNLTIDHKVNVLINRQVPVEVLVYFIEWSKTEAYQQIMRERAYIAKYKKSWEAAPHTPIFSTVDCLLTCGDYVLLIKRKREPGAGLWAMSGGFLEPSERIIDGVFRELSEESQIEVPEDFLRESIVGWHVEDEPTRDERGRIVSHICHVDLPYTCNMLPATRPADDAAESVWVHRKDLTMVDFYADHSYIVQKMLKFKFQ